MTIRIGFLSWAAASWLAAAASAEPLVLKADAWVDVEAGRRVTPGVVVVDGGRIAAINPAALPAGARTIELAGLTLLPGFIDAHVHLTSDLAEGWERRDVEWSDVDYVLLAAKNARLTLASGFTTVRNLGAGGYADVALMHAIDRGDVDGPRIVPAGYAIGATGGHCDATGYAPGLFDRCCLRLHVLRRSLPCRPP